jgi:hypothetical protein
VRVDLSLIRYINREVPSLRTCKKNTAPEPSSDTKDGGDARTIFEQRKARKAQAQPRVVGPNPEPAIRSNPGPIIRSTDQDPEPQEADGTESELSDAEPVSNAATYGSPTVNPEPRQPPLASTSMANRSNPGPSSSRADSRADLAGAKNACGKSGPAQKKRKR